MTFATVNEIYDMNTVSGRISLIKFHTPQDGVLQKHLAGHFMQYRRWMYGGMDIMMIPVATLPLDPLGVSLDPGVPNADPRDVINPICHRFYHGERLNVKFDFESVKGDGGVGGTALTDVPFGQSVQMGQILETDTAGGVSTYGSTLMDTSWKKAHIQRGFRVSARPFVYPLVTNHQIGESVDTMSDVDTAFWSKPPNRDLGNTTPGLSIADIAFNPTVNTTNATNAPTTSPEFASSAGSRYGAPLHESGHANQTTGGTYSTSNRYQNFMTTGMRPMGWMDTEPFLQSGTTGTSPNAASTAANTRTPLVYMYTALLPPAFKQSLYFRLIIRHKVAFKGYRSTQGLSGINGNILISSTKNINAGLITGTPISPSPAKASIMELGSVTIQSGEVSKVTDGVGQDE